ncbi:hypothetical protein L9F63_020335, partial [Diploptera punctata]
RRKIFHSQVMMMVSQFIWRKKKFTALAYAWERAGECGHRSAAKSRTNQHKKYLIFELSETRPIPDACVSALKFDKVVSYSVCGLVIHACFVWWCRLS